MNSTQLTNGLPVFLRKSKKSPIVTLQVWVRTGSADEFKNEAGLSHFIEHLVFKGTKNYKAGEIAQTVERAGGELNAYTSFDQTVFYVTVPKENFDVACSVLSDMMHGPLFEEGEVNNEREVVIEEIKMGLDQASRVSSKMLFKQMFSGYPYADPVIGTQENIARVSNDEIQSYFKDRYHLNNMSLVCVGDFENDEEVLKNLDKHFLKLNKNTAPKIRQRSKIDLSLAEQNVFQKSEFEKDYFYISWPVESFKEESSLPYEILALIIGQGESSFLYKNLKLNKDLCRSISASYFSSPENGIFVVSGICSPEEKEALFKELPNCLNDFLKQKDISEDISKAQNIFYSEQSYSEESIASQCRLIGDDWLYYDKFGATQERINKVLELTAEDINVCCKKLFTKKPYLSILASKPLDDTKTFLENIQKIGNSEVFLSASSEKDSKYKSKAIKKATNKNTDQDYKTWTSEKGSEVHFIENFETDVLSFKMGALGGELLLSDEQQGLSSLFGSLWTRETKSISEDKMSYLFDKYCSSFSAFSGKHSFGLSLKTLSYLFDDVKGAVLKSLNEAVFTDKLLKRDIQSRLYALKSLKDRPSSVAFKAFNEALFKDTFYARDTIGKESYFDLVKTDDLYKHLEDQLKQKRTYSVVGAIDENKLKDFINEIENEAEFSSTEDLFKSINFNQKKEKQTIEIESEKAQSHIVLGYPGFKYKDSEKIHLRLFEALFGGQGGRLFIELRDKASLAYSVAPVSQSAYFGGFFGGYIACDPSKKEKAISMMREEFVKFANEGLSDQELEWLKNQVLGQELMSYQQNSAISDQMLFDSIYGLDAREYLKLGEKLKGITAEDLSKTMKNILSQPEYLVSVG